VVLLTWPILYGQLWTKLSTALRRAPLAAINNSPPTYYCWSTLILGQSSIGSTWHRMCCKVGCITYRQQVDNKWSLSIIVQICVNNRTFCYGPSLVACSGNYNWWAVQYGRFLLRDAMLSAVYAVVVCLSVCLPVCVSVTFRYCIKTAKRRITQIMPHDRVFKWDVL